MQTKHRRGFTLIEMVVVIAIIGVLLALTAPLFSSFLESARKTACMANLTTATRTLEFYEVVENRTLTPDVIDTIMKDSMGADPTSSGYQMESAPQEAFTTLPSAPAAISRSAAPSTG